MSILSSFGVCCCGCFLIDSRVQRYGFSEGRGVNEGIRMGQGQKDDAHLKLSRHSAQYRP
jgi:hypothetical protein